MVDKPVATKDTHSESLAQYSTPDEASVESIDEVSVRIYCIKYVDNDCTYHKYMHSVKWPRKTTHMTTILRVFYTCVVNKTSKQNLPFYAFNYFTTVLMQY